MKVFQEGDLISVIEAFKTSDEAKLLLEEGLQLRILEVDQVGDIRVTNPDGSWGEDTKWITRYDFAKLKKLESVTNDLGQKGPGEVLAVQFTFSSVEPKVDLTKGQTVSVVFLEEERVLLQVPALEGAMVWVNQKDMW